MSGMTKKHDVPLREAALNYHEFPTPGKIAIAPTTPLMTQRDLSLAYSPGVAFACEEIAADPATASKYTSRGNMVAVITNGTAVLGLGAIGPLAAKPVMEGKAVLFKKFAGIDAIDIEIDETDPKKLIEIIAALEPSFGGINLEDIKAPECFEVEHELRERMHIPVFHDDQHGTAIIVAAAVQNWLKITGRKITEAKLVASGAGAAALACLDLLVDLGLPLDNITVSDLVGVVYKGRTELMDERKARYARDTNARQLSEIIAGADVFLGLSAGGVMKPEMVAQMGAKPLVLALANPTPEIMPDEVRKVKPDAIIATGRSDFHNQVNNVLCFPFIFRGALDVGATAINEAMKLAASTAIAKLAEAEPSDIVNSAYGGDHPAFGPDYIIPKPFDPRLIIEIAPAVAEAAMKSGVATRPIADMVAYRESLSQFVWRSGLTMRPIFAKAKRVEKRIAFAEGEEERVLRAMQIVVDEGIARPVLIGRREVIDRRLARLSLRLKPEEHFDIVDPNYDPRFHDYWSSYHRLMQRHGVTPADARTVVRTMPTVIGALLVRKHEADGLVCGTIGNYHEHLKHVVDVLGLKPGISKPSACEVVIVNDGTFFIVDPYVTPDPTPAEIAEMTVLAAEQMRRFGITPKVALLSHSNFGTHDNPMAAKMRAALALLEKQAAQLKIPLEIEGEMQADAALSDEIRHAIFPNSRLRGAANLLVMPTLDAANISFKMLRALGEGSSVGPVLLGVKRAAHILTPSTTVRGILNMTAVAAVDAQENEEEAVTG
jgi:malate dehydrogenase (oxaloacetate-decarboxylating)(NADP+)